MIDYRGESRNSSVCTFKANENAESVKLYPDDIMAYRFIDDKYYISKKINTHVGGQQVFVEFLVNGIANLYFYRDPNNYIYLIEGEDGILKELNNESVTQTVNGSPGYERETNKHIGILKATFADCKEIQPKIENTSLSHKSLINIAKEYHNYVCEDEKCIIYEKQLPAIRVQFAPVLGIGISDFGYKKGFYKDFKFDTSSSPTFGIMLNTIFPRINEKLSFQLEAIYYNSDFYSYHEDNSGYIDKSYEIFMYSKTLQSTLGLKYTFPKGKVRPSLATGVLLNVLINPSSNVYLERKHADGPQRSEIESLSLETTLYGAFIQLGCNYHIFKNREMFTNFRYISSSSENWGDDETFFKAIQFSVGFYLSKTR